MSIVSMENENCLTLEDALRFAERENKKAKGKMLPFGFSWYGPDKKARLVMVIE